MNQPRSSDRTKLTFRASGETFEVQFEPYGAVFSVSDGEWITLDLPVDAVSGLEFSAYSGGISVFIPTRGNDKFSVLDAEGNELDQV